MKEEINDTLGPLSVEIEDVQHRANRRQGHEKSSALFAMQ
jgi:hypothetical protein